MKDQRTDISRQTSSHCQTSTTVTLAEEERQREPEQVIPPPIQHPPTEATLKEPTLSSILAECQELRRKVEKIENRQAQRYNGIFYQFS